MHDARQYAEKIRTILRGAVHEENPVPDANVFNMLQAIDAAGHPALIAALAWHFEETSVTAALARAGIWPARPDLSNYPKMPPKYGF